MSDFRIPSNKYAQTNCTICNKPFIPTIKLQHICGTAKCKKAYAKIKNDEKAEKKRAKKTLKKCVVCKTEFQGHERNRTCGKKACKDYVKTQMCTESKKEARMWEETRRVNSFLLMPVR